MTKQVAVLALLTSTLAVVGCFDVRMVDPGPYVIDDFMDQDFEPSDPNFDFWMCYSFNPETNRNYKCDRDVVTGMSLFLQFTIEDVADGKPQNGGVSLATFTKSHRSPEDFTMFKEFVFWAALESGDPPLPPAATLSVELGCSAVDAPGYVYPPGELFVSQSVDYQADWKLFPLQLEKFEINSDGTGGSRQSSIACLQQVDSIHFSVHAEAADGASASGVLYVRKIELR